MSNCKKEVSRLSNFIDAVNADGKNMYIYGASTKGNCLLQFANIGEMSRLEETIYHGFFDQDASPLFFIFFY